MHSHVHRARPVFAFLAALNPKKERFCSVASILIIIDLNRLKYVPKGGLKVKGGPGAKTKNYHKRWFLDTCCRETPVGGSSCRYI